MTQKTFWMICGGLFLFILIVIAIGDKPHSQTRSDAHSESSDMKTGEHSIIKTTFGVVEIGDLPLVARAGRNSDTSGLLSLIASGRVYELDYGTQVYVIGNLDPTIVYVRVESGSAIGKTLYTTSAAVFNGPRAPM